MVAAIDTQMKQNEQHNTERTSNYNQTSILLFSRLARGSDSRSILDSEEN